MSPHICKQRNLIRYVIDIPSCTELNVHDCAQTNIDDGLINAYVFLLATIACFNSHYATLHTCVLIWVSHKLAAYKQPGNKTSVNRWMQPGLLKYQ